MPRLRSALLPNAISTLVNLKVFSGTEPAAILTETLIRKHRFMVDRQAFGLPVRVSNVEVSVLTAIIPGDISEELSASITGVISSHIIIIISGRWECVI